MNVFKKTGYCISFLAVIWLIALPIYTAEAGSYYCESSASCADGTVIICSVNCPQGDSFCSSGNDYVECGCLLSGSYILMECNPNTVSDIGTPPGPPID